MVLTHYFTRTYVCPQDFSPLKVPLPPAAAQQATMQQMAMQQQQPQQKQSQQQQPVQEQAPLPSKFEIQPNELERIS